MHAVNALTLVVVCPALVGALMLLAPRRAISLRVALAVAAPLLSLAVLGGYVAAHGVDAGPAGVPWMPSLRLDLSFQPDRLGLFFAFLVAGFGVPITLYTRAYFGPDPNALYRVYPILLLFMTGMLGLVLADSFVLLLLFWELTSVSSFLLIGWERDDPAAVKNAMQAFIVTGAGGISLLGGLMLLGVVSGAWSFSELAGADLAGWQATAAFALIFAGAAAKSAQWPLHFWLPSAMAAPTPISAYLHSATMVKAGVYLLGRLVDPLAALPAWPYVLGAVGAVTMVVGAYIAIRKTDLKLIFAYTTVSQLGLLVCMYGLAGFEAGGERVMLFDVTQIFNHALYKAPLFILAGAIAHTAYSRDLRDLFGLYHQGGTARLMAILLLLAAYAMASGPLTLGFTAKEFFLTAAYTAYQASGDPLLLGVLGAVVCQSALNVVIFIRLALTLLGPEANVAVQPPHDPSAEEERVAFEDYHAVQRRVWVEMLWIPAAAILALQYLGGIAPWVFDWLFGAVERSRGGYERLPGLWYAFSHPGWPLALSGLAIALGVVGGLGPRLLGRPPIWRQGIHDVHDRLFPAFYALVTRGGRRLFGLMQTGNLRTYLAVIAGTLVLLVIWSAAQSGAVPELSRRTLGDVPRREYIPIYAVGTLVCLGALLMPFIHHRAGRVMVLGTVGFGVASIFYLYSAPDLALTQVSIEIVGLILFLLALSMLPRTEAPPPEGARRLGRLALSLAVGGAMGWLVLSSSLESRPPMAFTNPDGRPFAHLGDFFLRNSKEGRDVPGRHPGGGGNNAVNVILVDFRGLDTMGEITVLAVAAIGVLTLLHRRARGLSRTAQALPESSHAGDAAPLAAGDRRPRPRHARGPRWRHRYSLTSEPLRVATKLLVPLSLLFACFVFFKGHQSPGGGFVAGLVAAVALIAHRMAHGRTSLRFLLRVGERTLIAVGLLLAAGTGLGATLLGSPFLTSRFGHLAIPGVEREVEWTTVLAFDLGVFLVVLGVVLTLINALSAEAEAT